MAVVLRPMGTADRAAVWALLETALTRDPLGAETWARYIDADPRTPHHPPRVACMDGEVCGVVQWVPLPGRADLDVVKLLAVAPAHQGRGIGTRLLEAACRDAAARGRTRVGLGGCPPCYVWPGLDPGYARALRLVRRLGFSELGTRHTMAVNLQTALVQADAPAWDAASPRLRRAEPNDAACLEALLRAHWPGWCDEVMPLLARPHVPLHVALDGARCVAFAAYDGPFTGSGRFGPMGTDPAYVGLGLGRKLLLSALRDMAAQGRSKAEIPWVGPTAFYRKTVGAQLVREFLAMEKKL